MVSPLVVVKVEGAGWEMWWVKRAAGPGYQEVATVKPSWKVATVILAAPAAAAAAAAA